MRPFPRRDRIGMYHCLGCSIVPTTRPFPWIGSRMITDCSRRPQNPSCQRCGPGWRRCHSNASGNPLGLANDVTSPRARHRNAICCVVVRRTLLWSPAHTCVVVIVGLVWPGVPSVGSTSRDCFGFPRTRAPLRLQTIHRMMMIHHPVDVTIHGQVRNFPRIPHHEHQWILSPSQLVHLKKNVGDSVITKTIQKANENAKEHYLSTVQIQEDQAIPDTGGWSALQPDCHDD